jgi:hypothetical protein
MEHAGGTYLGFPNFDGLIDGRRPDLGTSGLAAFHRHDAQHPFGVRQFTGRDIKPQTANVMSSLVCGHQLLMSRASAENYERTCTRAPLTTRQKSTTSRPSTRPTPSPVATKNERRREKKKDLTVVMANVVYSGGHVPAARDEREALNRV